MKKQFFLLPLMALLLFLGCAKEEQGNALDTIGPGTNNGVTYIGDVLVTPVDMSAYTFDNSVVELHQYGCDNGAYESLDDKGAGELSETRSAGAGSMSTCCSITNLSYTASPSPRVHAMINIGQAFESTNWFVRYVLVENTTNNILEDVLIPEPPFPLPSCAQERNSTRIFDDYINNVGLNCPNDHTLYYTRYYEWLDSNILVECCTKSINFSLPVDPNTTPC